MIARLVAFALHQRFVTLALALLLTAGGIVSFHRDREIARAGHRRRVGHLVPVRLGELVAVQDRAFAALLPVHDDLQRQPRAARPVGMRRALSVADEIARVAHVGWRQSSIGDASRLVRIDARLAMPTARAPPKL